MRNLGYLALLWMAALASSAVLAAPPTLDKPGKTVRFISLAEARAIALENGNIGQPSLLYPGISGSSITAPQQGELDIPGRVFCKPGSKCLILTGVHCDLEHEPHLHQLLLNVETAYWNLYGSYWQLYSREMGLRFAYMTWKGTEEQYKGGRASRATLAQAEGQYDLFRSQRLAALDTVLDNERQLRAMLGMKIQDSARLVPSDAPTLVEKKPDWKKGLHTTMKKRPELKMARQEAQLAGDKAALIECAANYIPLSKKEVLEAALQSARATLVREDQELKAERYLALGYRRMSSAYAQIKAAKAQREAFAAQFQLRYELYNAANEPGLGNPVKLSLLLEAQRFWAEALATEYRTIATYNNALACWEFAKGDILKHARVRLADKAPDDSDVMPAVQRERKRTRQHVRHEPPLGCGGPVLLCDFQCDKKTAPSLPALGKCTPLLKKVGDVQKGLVEGRAFFD